VRVNATSIIANAATLTIRGFEAAGSLTPFEGLTLSGSAAYVDVKVDAITLPANLVNFLTAAGRQSPTNIQIQGQPTWSANAGISAVYPEKVFGGELNDFARRLVYVVLVAGILLGATRIVGLFGATGASIGWIDDQRSSSKVLDREEKANG